MVSPSERLSFILLAFVCVAVVSCDDAPPPQQQQQPPQDQRIGQLEEEVRTVKSQLFDLKRVMLAFAVSHVGQYTDSNDSEIADDIMDAASKRSDTFKFYGSRGKKSSAEGGKVEEKKFSYLPQRGKRFYFQASRG
uniref:Uncharacterized protein n=1 Tax=Plectus sambesii TaxID=2011161 RepID=A0A914VYP7_9BILA